MKKIISFILVFLILFNFNYNFYNYYKSKNVVYAEENVLNYSKYIVPIFIAMGVLYKNVDAMKASVIKFWQYASDDVKNYIRDNFNKGLAYIVTYGAMLDAVRKVILDMKKGADVEIPSDYTILNYYSSSRSDVKTYIYSTNPLVGKIRLLGHSTQPLDTVTQVLMKYQSSSPTIYIYIDYDLDANANKLYFYEIKYNNTSLYKSNYYSSYSAINYDVTLELDTNGLLKVYIGNVLTANYKISAGTLFTGQIKTMAQEGQLYFYNSQSIIYHMEVGQDLSVNDAILNSVDLTNKKIGAIEDISTAIEKTITDLSIDVGNIVGNTTEQVGLLQQILSSISTLVNSLTIGLVGEMDFRNEIDLIKSNAQIIYNKFPFSLPWDLKNAIKSLGSTNTSKPTISFDIPLLVKAGSVHIDFVIPDELDVFSNAIRKVFLLIFNISLIFSFYKLVGE